MGTFRRRREWLGWQTELLGLQGGYCGSTDRGIRLEAFLTTKEGTKRFHFRIRLQTMAIREFCANSTNRSERWLLDVLGSEFLILQGKRTFLLRPPKPRRCIHQMPQSCRYC